MAYVLHEKGPEHDVTPSPSPIPNRYVRLNPHPKTIRVPRCSWGKMDFKISMYTNRTAHGSAPVIGPV